MSRYVVPGLCALAAAAVLFVPAAGIAAAPSVQALGPKPAIHKACGSIRVDGERLRVDISEVIGTNERSCRKARIVMRRFVKRNVNAGDVRYDGRSYGCYESRPDGEGWDYHCMWSSDGRYVGFSAGRRF